MTYTLEWITPDRILKATLPFKFDDVIAKHYDKTLVTYLDAAQSPIQLIVDVQQTRVHPAINTLLDWRHIRHPKLEQVIVVGLSRSPIVRFITNIMTKVVGFRLTGADDMAHALALLTKPNEPYPPNA